MDGHKFSRIAVLIILMQKGFSTLMPDFNRDQVILSLNFIPFISPPPISYWANNHTRRELGQLAVTVGHEIPLGFHWKLNLLKL